MLHLSHPGIPLVYDLEEDGDNFYLVEEYIPGKSLKEQMLYHTFSLKEICIIAIQICDILIYLQTLDKYIIYGDLKLDHIFFYKNQVKLVDFGIARYEDTLEKSNSIYITENYAAPEIIKSGYCKESDIYSLAYCLKLLYRAAREGRNFAMEKLIKEGLKFKPSKRPSVEVYERQWELLLEKQNKKGYGLCGNLYVLGQDKGVGCTHFAISLCGALNYLGEDCLYLCRDDAGLVRRLAVNDDAFSLEGEIIYHQHFIAADNQDRNAFDQVRIIDCGTEEIEISHEDVVIFLASSRAYKKASLPKIVYDDNCIVVVNPFNKGAAINLSRELNRQVFAFPLDQDPFTITKDKIKLFSKIRKMIYEQGVLC